jgi:hypothetical protein
VALGYSADQEGQALQTRKRSGFKKRQEEGRDEEEEGLLLPHKPSQAKSSQR